MVSLQYISLGSYYWEVNVTEAEQEEEHQGLLAPVLCCIGHCQLLLLVLDYVDVDGGGGDVVGHAVVLPGRVRADLLDGEDRLGEESEVGGEVPGGAGYDGVPVLPHD